MKQTKKDKPEKIRILPSVSPEWENSRGTTSEVPVTAPWVLPDGSDF